MATKNIVPNADSEGQLGTSSKFWSSAYLDGLNIGNDATANLVFTPSASDTITLAAAANGAFTITTVDAAAAAANVGFVVDGNFTVSNVTSTITSSSSDITTFATTDATSGYTEFAYNTSTVAGYIGNGTSLLSGAANTDFIMRSESGALKFTTGGGNLALTIDSSQNATFAGNISATDTGATVTIEDNADSTSGGTLALQNSDTGADNHESGRIYFYGDNDGNTVKETVLMRGVMTDASAGTEDTKLEILTLANSSQVSSLLIAGNGITIPNGSAAVPALNFAGNGDAGFYNVGGDNIGFAANGAAVYSMNTDGITLESGKGLFVGGTGSANKLDDYEEGTWDPLPYYQNADDQSKALAAQVTANQTAGFYTKIGNMVHVHGTITWNISDATSDIAIDNVGIKTLPFSSENTTNNFSAINFSINGAETIPSGGFTGELSANSTILLISSVAESGNQGRNLGTGDIKIKFSCSYRATT